MPSQQEVLLKRSLATLTKKTKEATSTLSKLKGEILALSREKEETTTLISQYNDSKKKNEKTIQRLIIRIKDLSEDDVSLRNELSSLSNGISTHRARLDEIKLQIEESEDLLVERKEDLEDYKDIREKRMDEELKLINAKLNVKRIK